MTPDTEKLELTAVWVFNGANSSTPSAVFQHRTDAKRWIASNRLTGMLTLYPVDLPVYDWAIQRGYFEPIQDYQPEGHSSVGSVPRCRNIITMKTASRAEH